MPINSASAFAPARLRKTIFDMAFGGRTVHIPCAFSMVELLAVLHRSFLHYPDNDPYAPDRDYLGLSKGHGVMSRHACMYEKGWLDEQDITARPVGVTNNVLVSSVTSH